jgi:hypothetical protein
MRRERLEEALFAVELGLARVGGQLVLAGHAQRLSRAGLHAEAAEDAAQHVDLVDFRVPVAFRHLVTGRVLARDDADAVRGTRSGAQRAADTLLQAILMPAQNVPSPPPGIRNVMLFRILLCHPLPGQRLLGRGEQSFGQRADLLQQRALADGTDFLALDRH